MLPAVLDQTILATALPMIAARPRQHHRPLVGRHRLRRGGGRVDAAVGQARRPPRPQAAARRSRSPSSSRPRRCAAPRRTSAADRRARRPGRARRRADDAGDGRGRRSRLAARARPLPGLHRRDVRRRDRRRPAASAACWWRTPAGAGCSSSTCPSASLALAALQLRLPARPRPSAPTRPLDVAGAALLAGATAAFMLDVHLGRRPLRVGLGADPRR